MGSLPKMPPPPPLDPTVFLILLSVNIRIILYVSLHLFI